MSPFPLDANVNMHLASSAIIQIINSHIPLPSIEWPMQFLVLYCPCCSLSQCVFIFFQQSRKSWKSEITNLENNPWPHYNLISYILKWLHFEFFMPQEWLYFEFFMPWDILTPGNVSNSSCNQNKSTCCCWHITGLLDADRITNTWTELIHSDSGNSVTWTATLPN